jgi:hypothetical protein
MNKSIALILSMLVTSTLALGCGSSSDNSSASAGKTGTDDNSSAGAGNDNSAGKGSSAGGDSSSNDNGGAPDMSDNGGAVDTGGAAENGGTAENGGSNSGNGGSAGAAMPTNAECKKLEPCCVALTAGLKDACNHVAGLNSGPSCTSVYSLYNCDSVLATASQPKTSACKLSNNCIQTAYSQYQAAGCMAGGGVASDTCPADGVTGCCSSTGVEQCTYTGNDSPITEESCKSSMNGTFSTTP